MVAGGAIGWIVAQRVQMTEMPQLVAAMHSLVGGSRLHRLQRGNRDGAHRRTDRGRRHLRQAGGAARLAEKIAHKTPAELNILKIEVFLGVFIGAVTFTGSVIAFGKLAGKVTSKAMKLPGGHLLNAGAALGSLILLVMYFNGAGSWTLIAMTLLAFFIGYHLIMGIGGADMPVVVSMLNSYSGWAAAAIGFSLSNDLLIVVGALVGSSGPQATASCARR
ncbi:MAG: NAD(P)(+) transhydrogenase (Re/Si-specific) subunit beta [Paracoccaceae bacterium]